MAAGTGVFMPRVAAEPLQQEPSCDGSAPSSRGAGQRSWSCTSLSSLGSPGGSADRSCSVPGGPPRQQPRSSATVRRVPWRAAGASAGASSAGLFAPTSSGASSFAVTELDDAAAFLSTSNSLPACPPGAGGDAWASLCSGSAASSTGMSAPPAQPCAAWLPGEPMPGLGLPAAAGGSSPVLIPMLAASMPPALGVSCSARGLGLGAAAGGGALTPELCSSSNASLAGWPGIVSGELLIASGGSLLQLADDAADARAMDSIDSELSALLQLRSQLVASQQATLATSLAPPALVVPSAGVPAAAPAAAAAPACGLASVVAQQKLQQLATVRAMEAQLQAEVAALLPLV